MAQRKQVVTTLDTAFIKFLVSWMTLSTYSSNRTNISLKLIEANDFPPVIYPLVTSPRISPQVRLSVVRVL